jgi:hypothetical protein
MGQFKPMVKMETTEPSIELKLKKGGSVSEAFKNAKKAAKGEHGHKAMEHKADGGALELMARSPALVGRPAVTPPTRGPAKPSMAQRRKAMAPAMSKKAMPMRKKGGEVESNAEHKAEMKKINKVESELKSHEKKPASKAHKGMKSGGKCYATGGVVKGQGGYKTGGVVDGQGGYATGGVVNGQGGFKKGGGVKKFADGGKVDSGKAEQMPQGKKKPSAPVAINMLSGSFKKGGNVSSAKLQATFKKENAPAMKAAKKDSDEVYSKYQKGKKMADGGSSYDESFASPTEQLREMRRMKNIMKGEGAVSDAELEMAKGLGIAGKIKGAYNKVKGALKGQGAVTDTERTISRTVTPPAKKCGGKV